MLLQVLDYPSVVLQSLQPRVNENPQRFEASIARFPRLLGSAGTTALLTNSLTTSQASIREKTREEDLNCAHLCTLTIKILTMFSFMPNTRKNNARLVFKINFLEYLALLIVANSFYHSEK